MRVITLPMLALTLLSSAALAQPPETSGDTIGHPPPFAGPAANSRTLVSDAACTSRFHASGKRTGAQRLHRGIWAPRSSNPVFHRSIPGDIYRYRLNHGWTWRLDENGQGGPLQHSRPRN
jgi:hypothetical protein